jgi:uncharacterized metal-binding protein
MTWSKDGDKHDRNCVIGAIAVIVVVTKLGHPALIGMAPMIVIWGLFFSPDLDLSETGRQNGGGCKAWHRWKRLGLGWLWKPYGKAFKHRSPYTHSLIPGTLVRLGYVFILPILLGLGYYLTILSPAISTFDLQVIKGSLIVLKPLSGIVFAILGSCFIADGIHLITDKIPLKDWIA